MQKLKYTENGSGKLQWKLSTHSEPEKVQLHGSNTPRNWAWTEHAHTHTRTYVAHTLSRSWLTIRKNHMKKSMKLRKTVFSLITASTSRSSEFANSQWGFMLLLSVAQLFNQTSALQHNITTSAVQRCQMILQKMSIDHHIMSAKVFKL